MSERPTGRLKRLRFLLLIQYILGLAVFPGVAGVLSYYRRPWATGWSLVTELAIAGGFTVAVLATSLTGANRAASDARARGLPEASAAVAAVGTRIALGAFLAVPPASAAMWCGWGWAIPFYVVYMLYGALMVRMLRRLEKAVREAQTA